MMPCHNLYAAHFARVETELMALGNHNLDAKLYFYLFNRMDADGIAGTTQRVSRARIALDLSEKGGQGKRKKLISFTANDVDVALLRLERAGLIQRVSDDTHLMIKFSAWLAALHSYAQNEVPKVVQKEFSTSHDDKTFVNQAAYGAKPAVSADEVTSEVPTIITTTTSTTTSTTQPLSQKFQMSLDWQPSESFWRRVAMAGLQREQVFKGWIGEFISFRSANDLSWLTQSQWEHKLLQNILGYIRNPQLGMSSKAAVASANPDKAKVVPFKRISVPNTYDASELQRWALKNGFRAAKMGESVEQYRAALRTLAEQHSQAQERQERRVLGC